MHPRNIHSSPYDFDKLTVKHSELKQFVTVNKNGEFTINFADPNAVFHLNKSLLLTHYDLDDYTIPTNYLCPPIPGRADYIHHIADLLPESNEDTKDISGLDIGVGANSIYPILGAQLYGWKMVGADIDKVAVAAAKANIAKTKSLQEKIEIRHQENNANIFDGIIKPSEYFDFTLCNPPFYASEKDALRATLRKVSNLNSDNNISEKNPVRNFGGQANELWVNGGEALFIKRMIKQSVDFKSQVGFFSTLVSRKENLNKLYKLLDKRGATHQTLKMAQGNKVSHLLIWRFQ